MEHTVTQPNNRALLAQLLKEKAERSITYEALSVGQRALWLEYQISPQGIAYNLMYRARLQPGTDLALLRQAFEILHTRHPILRSNFVVHEGMPKRRVKGFRAPDFRLIPCQNLDENELREQLDREADRPFDLGEDPMLRIAIFQREHEDLMALGLHHIATDFWSIDIMLNELARVYDALRKGSQAQLSAQVAEYREFTTYEAALPETAAGQKMAQYWMENLAGELPVLDLPFDRPRQAERTYRGSALPFELTASSSAQLRALGQQLGVTSYTLLLGLFKVLLYRYTGITDLIVGSPMTSRTRASWEQIMGYFVNLVALRSSLAGNPSFTTLVGREQTTVLNGLEHREFPFPLLVERLQPKRDPSRAAIFQTAFVWDQLRHDHVVDNPLIAETLTSGQRGAIFDFVFTIHESEGALRGTCEYDSHLFGPATIQRMIGHYCNLVAGLTLDPSQSILDVAILSEAEKTQTLYAWNDTANPFSQDLCLHQLFERSVDRYPEKLAAVGAGTSYTYAELEAEANRLASLLLEQSSGRPGYVGVCMDRSVHMLTSVLAIHKAGGSYIPLDVDWPVERLAMLLTQPDLSFVLTSQRILPKLQQIFWSVPNLRHLVVLDVDTFEPPSTPLQSNSVQDFWDHVVDSASDEISAGGFISAYTGNSFTQAEVDAYAEHVANLARPHLTPKSRVLEIGCGAGHITFQLAGEVGSWLATDPSGSAQRHNRNKAAGLDLEHLHFEQVFAHDLGHLHAGSFDMVLMASVVQFFPGYPYFKRVLDQVTSLLAPGGRIVVADLLDGRLKEQFRASLEKFRETHAGSDYRTKTHLDSEFYLDEGFMREWADAHPHIVESQVLRREGFQNELAFRFDVVLRKAREDESRSATTPPRRIWTGYHLCDRSPERLNLACVPEQLAYTIYTSGSTGTPKGVVLLHRPVVNLIEWVNHNHQVGPGDQLLFVTSLCFDLSVYDIFGTLAAGATVRVASTEEIRDPQRLVDILCEEEITFWDSAPAAMLRLTSFFPSNPQWNSSLRLVFFSGDWIPVTLPDQVRFCFPQAQIIGLGGATEAAIWSNFYPIDEVPTDWKSIPYGRPIQNAAYYVFDPHLNPLPVGVAGDLFIGGTPLASCYGADPRKSADKFLPNPYGEAGSRLYRTGDLVRFWVDGTMEFLGRRDHQVKIRGFRVELGEIEAALRQHPDLREAVVLAVGSGSEKRLVAYALPRDLTCIPGEHNLRQYLKGRIPEYMVPAHFVVMPQFPVTTNGKIDRAALPEPGVERPNLAAVFVAPEGEVEQRLAGLWGERLGLEVVGVDDNFFDLGGHSLMLADLMQDVRAAFEADLSMMDMFRNPTVRSLARRIEGGSVQSVRADRSEARQSARAAASRMSDRRRGSRGSR